MADLVYNVASAAAFSKAVSDLAAWTESGSGTCAAAMSNQPNRGQTNGAPT